MWSVASTTLENNFLMKCFSFSYLIFIDVSWAVNWVCHLTIITYQVVSVWDYMTSSSSWMCWFHLWKSRSKLRSKLRSGSCHLVQVSKIWLTRTSQRSPYKVCESEEIRPRFRINKWCLLLVSQNNNDHEKRLGTAYKGVSQPIAQSVLWLDRGPAYCAIRLVVCQTIVTT